MGFLTGKKLTEGLTEKDEKRIAKVLEEAGFSEEDVLAKAASNTGQLVALNKGVLIGREGAFTKLTHNLTGGVKFLRYRDISAVQFKDVGLTTGYIQLTIIGGKEGKKGIMEAAKDENTVTFNQNAEFFKNVRKVIQQKINEVD
jgi:hypothetical protein